MPIYEYTATKTGCAYCEAHFEQLEKLHAKAIEQCPKCGAPVQRVISAPAVVSGQAHRQSKAHLEKHGFTQYRRAGKGIYEKTAGKGPRVISDD